MNIELFKSICATEIGDFVLSILSIQVFKCSYTPSVFGKSKLKDRSFYIECSCSFNILCCCDHFDHPKGKRKKNCSIFQNIHMWCAHTHQVQFRATCSNYHLFLLDALLASTFKCSFNFLSLLLHLSI